MGSKNFTRRVALAFGLLMLVPTLVSGDANARRKKKKRVSAQPAAIARAPKLKPKGLKWKLSPKAVIKLYNRAIDRDYNKKFSDVEPGIQMKRLKYEIKRKRTPSD